MVMIARKTYGLFGNELGALFKFEFNNQFYIRDRRLVSDYFDEIPDPYQYKTESVDEQFNPSHDELAPEPPKHKTHKKRILSVEKEMANKFPVGTFSFQDGTTDTDDIDDDSNALPAFSTDPRPVSGRTSGRGRSIPAGNMIQTAPLSTGEEPDSEKAVSSAISFPITSKIGLYKADTVF
jgi:hypothetical protein